MKNLVTLQELFENSVFRVPDYQRGYSWENWNRRDLLEDLESLKSLEGGIKKHYTGTVVLAPVKEFDWYGDNYTQYHIVDGQQRLTTIVILLNELMKELRRIGHDEAEATAETIQKRYIENVGRQSSIYKLELDDINNDFFRYRIIKSNEDVEVRVRSHQHLLDARAQFNSYFRLMSQGLQPAQYFEQLKALQIRITSALLFTVYIVDDDSEAGVIFEVMNDRGKPLTELEKTKNLLLYSANRISTDDETRKQLSDAINFTWKEVLSNLARTQRGEDDEDRFLRVNAIINFYHELSPVTEDGRLIGVNSQLGDVHKLMRNRLKTLEKSGPAYQEKSYNEIRTYIDSLRSTSSRFRDIIHPEDSVAFQSVSDEAIKKELRLAVLQFRRMEFEASILPLLVSIYERFYSEPNLLLQLMKKLEAFAFRVYGIGDKRPYTAQNALYSMAAAIHSGSVGYDSIITELRALGWSYVMDEQVHGFLTDPLRNYYEWEGLHYFLYEYEKSRCREEGRTPFYVWEDLMGLKREDTIEHVLPQSIREPGHEVKYWSDRYQSKEEHEKNLNRLGNLTLTEKNSSLGNKDFDAKKAIYAKSRWVVENDLTSYSDWREADITDRETELADFAKQRWSL